MAKIKISLIIVIVLFANNLYSQTLCSELEDDQQRLSCYDQSSQSLSTNEASYHKLTKLPASNISTYFQEKELFQLAPQQPNYILPVSYNSNTNDVVYQETGIDTDSDNVEVKFQLSGRLKVAKEMYDDNWDLWVAYTHTSWWQLYNSEQSAPFRETNYSPEIFTTYYSDIDVFGFKLQRTDLGFIHQSNGRGEPLSRSWNRLYANFELNKGNYLLSLKPWYRIPESESEDDNPDIEDYMGYGDYRLTYKGEGSVYSILYRNNFKFNGDNKSTVELSWAFPAYDIVNIYIQYFNGYGESLIDYNHRVNRISVGILVYDWY